MGGQSVSGEGFTFSGAGFVLLTVNVTVMVVKFVLVSKTKDARATFGPRVFDMEHVGMTPLMYLFNFLFVICTVLRGPTSPGRSGRSSAARNLSGWVRRAL